MNGPAIATRSNGVPLARTPSAGSRKRPSRATD